MEHTLSLLPSQIRALHRCQTSENSDCWLTLACWQLGARACQYLHTQHSHQRGRARREPAHTPLPKASSSIPEKCCNPFFTEKKSHLSTARSTFIPGERASLLKVAGETRNGTWAASPAAHWFKGSTLLPALGLQFMGWPPLHPLSMLRSLCITTTRPCLDPVARPEPA